MIISCHESLAILIKHTLSNNSDLFPIARTSEKSHVLCIPTDIGVKFSLGEHILKEQYDAGISMATLGKQPRNDGAFDRFYH